MDKALINRLENVREELGINQIKFCEFIGVSVQTYNGWKNGKFVPKINYIIKVYKRWPQYNLEWLITGDGDKIEKGRRDDVISEPSVIYQGKEVIDQKMIKIFEYALRVLKET